MRNLLRRTSTTIFEKIEWLDVRKEFLTQEELIKLAETSCKQPVLKSAFLFSCLTGLRISDIEQLTWENIQIAPDMDPCIRIRTKKTQTEAILPISYEAWSLCGERGGGKVFKGISRSMINYPLKKWIKEAGITKHITFHCCHHTFATLELTMGADLYTTSKLLGHKNINTTTIYAKIVNRKKEEAVSLLDSAYE